MAGVYSFPLLVELEDNNFPKLKNKLVKYFQSKKCGGSGDCEVDYENGSRTATLRFRREEGKCGCAMLCHSNKQINCNDNRVVIVLTVIVHFLIYRPAKCFEEGDA